MSLKLEPELYAGLQHIALVLGRGPNVQHYIRSLLWAALDTERLPADLLQQVSHARLKRRIRPRARSLFTTGEAEARIAKKSNAFDKLTIDR